MSKAAAKKLAIILKPELPATSGETSAANIRFEIWITFKKLNSAFIIRIKSQLMGYLLRWIK